MVGMQLANGSIVSRELLIYPNELWAVQDADAMPFDPERVVRVFQTLKT